MSLVHPHRHLPPLPAQAAPPHVLAHQYPVHHTPAHHAPASAKAAAHCAPAPHAATPPAQTRSLSGFLHNVPGSLKSAGKGILGIPKMAWDTAGDIGTSLSDGVDSLYNRAYGDKDIADADDKEAAQADARTRETVLNLVPFGGSHGGIAHYGEAFGDWATSLTLPPDQAAAMRQEGGAALHRANQYIEDMAYKDPAGFAANLLPLAAVGRAAALGRLGKLADGAEAGAREAAAAGNTAKAARLGQEAARYRQAISLARGGKAGAALRDAKARAAEKLSAKAKASLAKGKAAVAKRRERRLNEERMASPGKLRDKWNKQGGGHGHGQPALAGVSGGKGGGTAAIGRPGGKSGMMQTVSHGPGHTPMPRGRVAASGGRMADYKTYDTDAKVPAHYSSDPRFRSLATDPAHLGITDEKMRQEAMAGLEAEHQKLIPGPISRGPKEIEFYDGDGHPWDVKTPPSPMPGATWPFKAREIAGGIKKELTSKGPPAFPPGTYPNGITGVPEARQVLLDSSYMNPADHAALWRELDSTLSQNELQRIVEINTRP